MLPPRDRRHRGLGAGHPQADVRPQRHPPWLADRASENSEQRGQLEDFEWRKQQFTDAQQLARVGSFARDMVRGAAAAGGSLRRDESSPSLDLLI